MSDFLKVFGEDVCLCACLCVCPLLRLLITSDMMLYHMPYVCFVIQVLQLCMTTVVGIIDRSGLDIDTHFVK